MRWKDEGDKHEQRKEGCRHHWRLAGHGRSPCRSISRARLRGGRDGPVDRPTNDDQILVVPGDITDRKTAERAISEGLARFGRIDTLINNAGVFVATPFTQYTEADYAAVLGVNLTGFFHITQLAIAEMEKRHSGHVVQITTSLVEHAN